MEVLGFGRAAKVSIENIKITPSRPLIGERIVIAFQLTSTASRRQGLLVDCRIHYVKANGSTAAKVFKLKRVDLGPGEAIILKKSISLGGTVSAEHGIGKTKREFLKLLYGEKGIKEMFEVKKALDPNLILGKGNIFE